LASDRPRPRLTPKIHRDAMNTNDLLAMLNGGLPPRSGGGPPARGGARDDDDDVEALISFRAGRMTVGPVKENGKHMITAEKKRGIVRIVRGADSLLHFQWKIRKSKRVIAPMPSTSAPPSSTSENEDDHVIFPDETTFAKVDTGRPEDRVYLLQCDESRRFFYWMQDADASKDEEVLEKIATNLAPSPPDAAPAPTVAVTPGAVGASGSGHLSAASISQPGGAATSSTAAKTSPATPAGRLTLADLRGAMAGLSAAPSQEAVGPALHDLVTAESATEAGVLNDPAVRERLTAALPEGQRGDNDLEENLRSPQVRQALRTLTGLVAGDSFNSVIANFQLDERDGAEAMAAGNPIRAFLDCVVASVKREKEEEEGKGAEAEGKEEDMKEG